MLRISVSIHMEAHTVSLAVSVSRFPSTTSYFVLYLLKNLNRAIFTLVADLVRYDTMLKSLNELHKFVVKSALTGGQSNVEALQQADDSSTSGEGSGTTFNTITVVTSVLAFLNIILIVMMAVYCSSKMRRRQQADDSNRLTATGATGHSISGFTSAAGTVRSFRSLASKFGAGASHVGDDGSSSIGSLELDL